MNDGWRGSRKALLAAAAVAVVAGVMAGARAQVAPMAGSVKAPADDELLKGFVVPPEAAKPRVWWHWTAANITKEGITKDLEWMKRAGIGGFMLADVASAGGQEAPVKINFFTPEWLDAVHHAAAEADRLGLEMSIFSSAGWSETGGPWVKSQEAMKKLVWSETDVTGPKQFNEALAQPVWTNGTFGSLRGQGNAPYSADAAANGGRGARAGARAGGAPGAGGGVPPTTPYYGDSAVIAFRTPDDEMTMEQLHPIVTSSGLRAGGAGGGRGRGGPGGAAGPGPGTGGGAPDTAPPPPPPVDPSVLMDDKVSTSLTIVPPAEGGPAWVQYEFAQPIKARAVTLMAPGRGIAYGSIQASDDGKTFRSLVETPGPEQYRAGIVKTYAFPETTAKFFRVVMNAPAGAPAEVINQTAPLEAAAGGYSLAEFIVHTGARVDLWEEKAGFNFIYEYDKASTPAVPATSAIGEDNVIDLTSKFDKDGYLHWDVPAGKWTIMRMGYSLTGSQNRPSTPAGQGPEVDKLNAKYVASYYHGYFDPLEKALGPLFGKSLRNVMMDSFEGGSQNWTDDMIDQFKRRRGYDPRPYLPVLAGHVVGSADISDRFLWDFRRTIADLLAEAHYGTMDKMLKEKGITISAEAAGVSMEIMEDTLLNKSEVDIPMGEFWLGRMHPPPEYYADVRMAASASHAYGKKLVATESFTGGGYEMPATYKNLGDYWFAQGVNRIVFHTSAHQPLDTKPGNIMVGTHVNRNITWAEEANGVMDYLSRTSYMLQRGLFVADCAYLLNEGVPSSQPFWGAGIQPTPPDGYDYDTVNADILLNRMKVADDGRIVLPDGMSYRMLVLPQVDRMRPELLRKIKELALGGATILGPKPKMSPSLQGGAEKADAEVKQLANEIWGDLDGTSRNWHYYGKGKVVWGVPPGEVLKSVNIVKDAEFAEPLDSNTVWIHRRTNDADLYFVANRTDKALNIEGRFRVDGKAAELWHPDSGASEPAGYEVADGRTTVPLHLDPRESVFVVFRGAANGTSRTIAPPGMTALTTLEGPWDVAFEPNLGAPAKITLNALEPWSKNADDGVKYFSGTATYSKTIQTGPDWLKPGAKVVLDLGNVRDLADVSINGKPVGLLWKKPFRLDVTSALQPGENKLELKITNEWTNRMMGDAAGPPEKRVLTGGGGGRGGARGGRGGAAGGPPDSGLLGPVTFVQETPGH